MTIKPTCPFCGLEQGSYRVGFLGGGMIFGVDACDTCCARLQLAESKRDDPESWETYRVFHERALAIRRERDDEDPGVMTMPREEFEDATVRPCPNCNAPGEKWRPKNAITEEGAQHVRCSGDCLLSASWKVWQALPRREEWEEELQRRDLNWKKTCRNWEDLYNRDNSPRLKHKCKEYEETIAKLQQEKAAPPAEVFECARCMGVLGACRLDCTSIIRIDPCHCTESVPEPNQEKAAQNVIDMGASIAQVIKEMRLYVKAHVHGFQQKQLLSYLAHLASLVDFLEKLANDIGSVCPGCEKCKTPDGHTCCDKEDCSSIHRERVSMEVRTAEVPVPIGQTPTEHVVLLRQISQDVGDIRDKMCGRLQPSTRKKEKNDG